MKKKKSCSGVKHDKGKLRYDLLPPDALDAVVAILTHGTLSGKYSDRNWEKGMSWGKIYGATMRHFQKWWSGDSIDKESKMSHLAHSVCDGLMLLTYELRGIGKDDRNHLSKKRKGRA